MELMQEVKGYSDSREEEEEEDAAEEIITREESSSKHHYPFSSPSLSLTSAPSISNYTTTTATAAARPHHHHHVINIPHQQNPWLGMNIHDDDHDLQSPETTESHNSSSGLGLLHQHQDAAGSNFIINNHHHHHHTTKQLDFMELSLGSSKDEGNLQGSGGGASSVYAHHHASASSSANGNNLQQQPAEKEHMFDKVVTPSDVGKLNRLVIPKQHAEKYFPLDSAANEKGLLLNFEDRNGKLWRFRYSYWNSSQSYVMTKGWSRFVKEKKLDAGDIVSFQRGVGELYRHRLYIDWRRRLDHHHNLGPDPSTTLFTPFFLPNQPQLMSIRWGATGRLYSLPSPAPPRHHDHLQQQLNYNAMYHQHHHPFHHHGAASGNATHHYNYHEMSNSGSGSVFYLRSTPPSMPLADLQTFNTRLQQQQEGGNVSLSPMIIDSVPVAHHLHHQPHAGKSGSDSTSISPSTAGKRLRLFGVNMECASSTSEDPKCFNLLSSSSMAHVTMANSNSLPSSSLPPLQLLREDSLSSPSARFGDQRGGEPSMLFDLDPSLQYRQ